MSPYIIDDYDIYDWWRNKRQGVDTAAEPLLPETPPRGFPAVSRRQWGGATAFEFELFELTYLHRSWKEAEKMKARKANDAS